ncbi:MAG: MFS transporter [Alphaproteobacteria bacterium]
MSTDAPPPPEAPPKLPLRAVLATYSTGIFSHSQNIIYGVIVPLWAVYLELSPVLIGIVIGARHVLPVCLSIHGGTLMDRFGTRRIMVVFGCVSAITAVLFPLLPAAVPLIMLQLLNGLATNMGWVGAQTLVGHMSRGDPAQFGRLTFATRLGTFVGPIVIGAVWEHVGPWGAFVLLAFWSLALLAAVRLAEIPDQPASDTGTRPSLGEIMPKLADYIAAFAMLAVPVIAFVMAVSAIRIGGTAIRSSFYVVYLDQIGLTGTAIGFLVGSAEIIGAAGALSVGLLARRFSPHWLFLVVVVASVVLIMITPLLGSLFPLLLLASLMRGGTLGLSQPLMTSILSKAAGPKAQGVSVGLRTAINGLISMILPVIMGAVATLYGLEESFIIIGAALLLMCLAAAWGALHANIRTGD